jgi:Fe-S cluster assembly protein SufD
VSVFDEARDHVVATHAEFAAAHADALAPLRLEALAAFAESGLPDTKREEWRYTNVTPIAKARFELAGTPSHEVSRDDLESHAFPVFACSVFVYVNGRFAPELSSKGSLPDGTRIESLRSVAANEPEALASLGTLTHPKEHPFAAWNTAYLDDGAVVRVPRGVRCETPIHLVFVSAPTETAGVVHPRVLVQADSGSHVQILQDHVTVGNAAGFTNPVTEIEVADDASVDFVLLQREPDHRFHVANLSAKQARNSRVSAHTLCLGGALLRNDAAIELAGEGAECDLRGLFVGGGKQVLDNHTWVDHAVPHCTSREVYKGILGGAARGVFRGRVVVRPDAQKTSASQSNQNLLVGGKAEIDTKPQLEIYADDVKCSHGSTVGQLDADALFYLRARGIGESHARDLLTRAFGLEILNALPVPALGEALDGHLFERLRHARQEAPA